MTGDPRGFRHLADDDHIQQSATERKSPAEIESVGAGWGPLGPSRLAYAFVRNLLERMMGNHANRLAAIATPTRDQLMTLEVDDLADP